MASHAAVPDVGQALPVDAARDGVPQDVRFRQAGKLRRCKKRIAHGLGAPFLEGRRPVPDQERRADRFQVAVLRSRLTMKSGQVIGRAGMNQAEIPLHRVVLAEQHQILVGAPDGFLQVAPGFFEIFRELVNLGFVQFQIIVVNGLPGEHLAGVLAQGVRRFRHAQKMTELLNVRDDVPYSRIMVSTNAASSSRPATTGRATARPA